MLNNKIATYIDAETYEVLYELPFYDNELSWRQHPRTREWYLHSLYEGRVMPEWLAANPKPRK